jgi:cellulose synthase/poly-beta-1,6-N-acetylglucosamine synthase-like glycosyltransferase
MIDALALTLGLTHFTIPLVYYYHLTTRLNDPWGLTLTPTPKPKISLIIPTYLESTLIKQKLDDIKAQDYPTEKMEVVVVDSASEDGTPEKVREWIKTHPGYPIKLIEEDERKGKAHALNRALRHTDGASQIAVTTDVDCRWEKNALGEAIKYFSDPTVGAVTCVKSPATPGPDSRVPPNEERYRDYNTKVRIAESKIHSTPIFHGELAAYRIDALQKIGGFREDIGADDSHTAALLALDGYRSICAPETHVTELVPSDPKTRLAWRTRRAQHLIQHFQKVWRKPKNPRSLARVINIEAFLHLYNPLILLSSTTALLISLFTERLTPINTLITASIAITLLLPPPRDTLLTWTTKQITLIIALIRNSLIGPDIIWKKARDAHPPNGP